LKVTNVEILRSVTPVRLSAEYLPAWQEPGGRPRRSFSVSVYRVHTDAGIVGFGPYWGEPDAFARTALTGLDPFYVERFWDVCMRGRELTFARGATGGLEIALWDIVGKALGQPVYKLLGACRDKVLAYAATNRLLPVEEHVAQVRQLQAMGFQAVKLRLHRADPKDDLAVVAAVRDAVGDAVMLLVDANQNNRSRHYRYWSRRTARWMARELDALNVYFLEEPLPRRDVDGLADLAASVDMYIAGGEHSANIFEFKAPILRGAYDILQPDLILGDIGITGVRKIASLADYFHRLVVPHVCSTGSTALALAATLQAVGTIANCPMVEYPYDPPLLTENQQTILKAPIRIDVDGYLTIPAKPGLGVEVDQTQLIA
jgi:L-alanine-DL-glutamate epimerase-like enolase superfamily enzyme